MPEAANLLGQQTSLYLLQHADNPVNWRPWGADALEEARSTDRPILLSIGYSACHWCHVMAHESFEDPETAALMNTHYINIKVDREERPDIDHLYMSALQALGEHGGWPLTMFLTPEGNPFWGGTYFPPEPRWGRPSFRQVLQGVANAYRQQHDSISQNVAALRQTLNSLAQSRPGGPILPQQIDDALTTVLQTTDPVMGGLRGAPKFPNPPIFRFVWQAGLTTGNTAAAEALHLLLRRMSDGGIYDHLGGGFARYSTDGEWLAPHFEKMLYDNAQLLDLLALAYAAEPDPLYAARVHETVLWLNRDMSAPDSPAVGAFASSEDADSEGEEGRFYVWTAREVTAALGADAPAFMSAYDVTDAGNWEGKSILRRVTPPGDATDEAVLGRARDTLLAVRGQRVRPGRDDKILADWNGLAIAALVRCAAVFNRPAYLERAIAAFDFVIGAMMQDNARVAHAWRLGRNTAPGLLDDQACMAKAALALFEATGDSARLDRAYAFITAALDRFADADGTFFITAADAADVPMGPKSRPRVIADNATPAGNGMMAEVFARLYHLTGDPVWRTRADAIMSAFSGLGSQLRAAPTLLAACDLLENGTLVVIAGDAGQPATHALLRAALGSPDPAVCVLRGGEDLPAGHPAHGKVAPAGRALAFVCHHGTCGLPIENPTELTGRLARRARL